jgi:hypothetical protein
MIAVAYGLTAAGKALRTYETPARYHLVLTFILGVIHLIISDSIVWLCVSALYGHVRRIRYPLLAVQISAFIGAVFVLVFVDNNSQSKIYLRKSYRDTEL